MKLTNKEAIDRLNSLISSYKIRIDNYVFDEDIEALSMGVEALENQKTGHWIKREIEATMRWKECSECHSEYPNMNGLNYCPNCGAKMEGE